MSSEMHYKADNPLGFVADVLVELEQIQEYAGYSGRFRVDISSESKDDGFVLCVTWINADYGIRHYGINIPNAMLYPYAGTNLPAVKYEALDAFRRLLSTLKSPTDKKISLPVL